MNIKQKLEAEAEQIVGAFRKEGGDINELIAKRANDKGFQGEQVRSLVWLINRHNFKQARQRRESDEIALANPEEVLLLMGRASKSASVPAPVANVHPGFVAKEASLGGQATSFDAPEPDRTPVHAQKLASRRMELAQQQKLASAKITAALYRMGMLAESVKRAGLLESETFLADLDRLPETVRPIIDAVFSHVKVARQVMPEGQLRMYLDRALGDFREMAKAAATVHVAQKDLAEVRERIERVDALGEQLRVQA